MIRHRVGRWNAAEQLDERGAARGNVGIVLDEVLSLIFFGRFGVMGFDHFASPFQHYIEVLCSDAVMGAVLSAN